MTTVAGALSALAFALLTVGFLRDLWATWKGAAGAAAHPGLAWTRPGTLALWAALAARTGFGLAEAAPFSWPILAAALGFTAVLHLGHVQGWKGPRARLAGLGCWAISLAVLGLGLAVRP